MSKQEWVNFYRPDGYYLGGYTAEGTFEGEAQATKELLAADYGIAPEEIQVRVEAKPPKRPYKKPNKESEDEQ